MVTKSLVGLAVTSAVGAGLHFAAIGYASLYTTVRSRVDAEVNQRVDAVASALGYQRPAPVQVQDAIEFAKIEAQLRGIHPDLGVALLRHESAANEFAESPVGARGLMQIMPANFKRCGLKSPNELWEWRKNIRCGMQIFGEELERYNWDVVKGLKAYNGGPNCAEKFECSESVQHSRAVLKLFGNRELAVRTGKNNGEKTDENGNANRRVSRSISGKQASSAGLRGKPGQAVANNSRGSQRTNS